MRAMDTSRCPGINNDARRLKKPRRRQVQAQLGPGDQEMGGFWPCAASALAKRASGECGAAKGVSSGLLLTPLSDSATVWQAWQAAQASQGACAAGDEPCPLPSQSARGVIIFDATDSWSKWPSALPEWAPAAINSVVKPPACRWPAAMPVAIKSPAQPRRSSRKIIAMNKGRRIGE